MNKRIIWIGILIATLFYCGGYGRAEEPSSFQKANELYQKGMWAQSAQIYEDILRSQEASEIYYNLGNAYFKLGQVGRAILNYERARRLDPRDRQIISNLRYAKQTLEYEIENKKSWYQRKLEQLLKYVTLQESWMLALGMYFLFMAGLIVRMLRRKIPTFGRLGTAALLLTILLMLPVAFKYSALGTRNHAVVTAETADVLYGPSFDDNLAFRLTEGLEVAIEKKREDWYLIELNDGRQGWVAQSSVTPIAT